MNKLKTIFINLELLNNKKLTYLNLELLNNKKLTYLNIVNPKLIKSIQ
jgi:hypothetical protein